MMGGFFIVVARHCEGDARGNACEAGPDRASVFRRKTGASDGSAEASVVSRLVTPSLRTADAGAPGCTTITRLWIGKRRSGGIGGRPKGARLGEAEALREAQRRCRSDHYNGKFIGDRFGYWGFSGLTRIASNPPWGSEPACVFGAAEGVGKRFDFDGG